jgi:hypothetical protein
VRQLRHRFCRYEAVNAMLLDEFLKEHQKVGDLEKKQQNKTA